MSSTSPCHDSASPDCAIAFAKCCFPWIITVIAFGPECVFKTSSAVAQKYMTRLGLLVDSSVWFNNMVLDF